MEALVAVLVAAVALFVVGVVFVEVEPDLFAGAAMIAASRAEYLRIEREAMDAWEDACGCPEPQTLNPWETRHQWLNARLSHKKSVIRPDAVLPPPGYEYAPMQPPPPGYAYAPMQPPMPGAYYERRNMPAPGSEFAHYMNQQRYEWYTSPEYPA